MGGWAAGTVGKPMNDLDAALRLVRDEYLKAVEKHPPMHSAHEGHSVIREELDELWDLVREDRATNLAASHEAAQIGAMAVRYIIDICHGAGTR
jgi:hypothetical protein